MAFNAFMPGEDNWMRQQPMPGMAGAQATPQPQMPSTEPQKKRPILNAFADIMAFSNPEAYQQGATARQARDKRQLTKQLGNALAAGDYNAAAEMAFRSGDLEAGEKYRTDAETRRKTETDEQRKTEAQGTYQLFNSMQPAQINDYAMQDPVGFERMTGMSSEEYLQSAKQMQQYGMTQDQFRQFVIQRAQAELGIEGQQTEYEFTNVPGVGLVRTDPRAGVADVAVAAAPKPEDQFEQYYENGRLMQRNSRTGQVSQVYAPPSGGIRIGPDGSVQIGGPVEGLGYGSAPKGQDAAIAFDPQGNPIVTPGPQQEAYNKAIRGFEEFKAQNSIVVQDIDRALGTISGWSTGAGAALKDLPIIGGITPAGQLESLLSTIQANVGFDKLQAMREASPTGGALGSVTEKELAFLQSVFGSLRQDTSAENVRFNLERLKTHMQGREARIQAALEADFPSLATTAQRRAGAKTQVQELNDLYDFMTPEERALFEGGQ